MAGEMNYLTDHPGDKRSDPHTKVLTLHEEEIYRKAAEYKDRIAASIKR